MKTSIRIYGDSISLPRCCDGVPVEMSWPALAATALGPDYVVVNRSVGGATVDEMAAVLEKDQPYFKNGHDVVVIWLGIVDCAPRPVPPFVRALLARLPFRLRSRAVGYLHVHRTEILRKRHWVNTPIASFRRCLDRMLESIVAGGGIGVCVAIGPISRDVAARCPGFDEEIARYNDVIRALVACRPQTHFLDLNTRICAAEDGGLLGDGHHHTIGGNRVAAEALAAFVRELGETHE